MDNMNNTTTVDTNLTTTEEKKEESTKDFSEKLQKRMDKEPSEAIDEIASDCEDVTRKTTVHDLIGGITKIRNIAISVMLGCNVIIGGLCLFAMCSKKN